MVIQRILRGTVLVSLALTLPALAQTYSEWIDASGMVQVEYRWKPNDSKGCDVEYHSTEDRGKRRYKIRVVYQVDGEEHDLANKILAFENGVNTTQDRIAQCSMITDVTVTGW